MAEKLSKMLGQMTRKSKRISEGNTPRKHTHYVLQEDMESTI